MKNHSQFSLLAHRRFGPFFATQALGAFNDNLFKNAVLALIVFQIGRAGGMTVDQLTNLAALLFILPYFLFSAVVGQFPDRFEKAAMIRRVKLFEVFICLFAGVGLYLGSVSLLMAVVFLLGFQSTLFGPIKYSILPQVLNRRELTGGNGLVAAGTFIAILAGTLLGPVITKAPAAWPYWVLAATGATALAGYGASLLIPRVPIPDKNLKINWNPVTETWRNLRHLGSNRVVFNGVLGVSWFWFFGSIILIQIPSYTKNVLGGDEVVLSCLLGLFVIGVSAGAVLCDKLSGRHVEIGLVPLGALGLTLFAADLYWASPVVPLSDAGVREVLAMPGIGRVIFDLVMLGVAGGLYIVPLYALVQSRADEKRRARVIAGMNILNALLMVSASVVAMVVLGVFEWSIPRLFLLAAVLNFLVAAYIFSLVPAFALRFLMWVLTRLMYRVRARGMEHVPEHGPALVVCNHVSYMDPLLVGGSIARPIRFVMYYKIYNTPGLRWLFKLAGAIPVAPAKEDPECLERAYEAIDRALANGEVVGIFPEGGLTPDGQIKDFKPGVEKILARRPVPVVAAALDGLWGSVFSRAPRRGRSRGWFSRVHLAATPPLPPSEVEIADLQQRVQNLHDNLRQAPVPA